MEQALTTAGSYEAAFSVFRLDTSVSTWKGEQVEAPLTWTRYMQGRSVFSDAAFIASSETEQHRSFRFPGSYPTAVHGMADVQAKPLARLPIFAGRAVVLGWYGEVDDALNQGLTEKLKHLVAAGLSIVVEMRVAPSADQVIKAAFGWSENMKTLNTVTHRLSSWGSFVL